MTERRLAYSRKQVAVLLGVSERTLIRWHREGLPPRVVRDPMDPLKRCYYDRKEIDRLAKRLRRRKSGAHAIDLGGPDVPFDPTTFEPAVPGPVAASVYQMLAERVPIDEICRRTGVAPEHVIRLERLRRDFEAQRAGGPDRPSGSRLVIDDDDPELAEWGKHLDDRARDAASESSASLFDDEEAGDDENESGPDSKTG